MGINTKIKWLIVVVAILFAGWTGIWFYAASLLKSEIEARLVSHNPDHRQITCVKLDIGGFPFRLSAHCQSVDMQFRQEQVSIQGKGLFAIAQIYAPRHILFEAEGPFQISSPVTPGKITASWSGLQGSLRFSDQRIERLSVVATEPRVDYSAPDGTGRHTEIKALEFHARPTPEQPAGSNDIDIALSAEAIRSTEPFAPLQNARLNMQAQIKAAPRLPAGSLPQILRIWHDAGGQLELSKATLSDDSGLADLSGTFLLDPELALNGRGTLFTAITGAGASALTQLSALMTFLGDGAERDGQPGTEAEFRIENGRMTLETLDLGPAPRLVR
ncbi:DUF2125 domain-containing protein [Coralliovum pocilloporae]|uniref:DUF2125 domain-containing protein n=1 Tax=Coralliovum pocilloporae TaxID=3066369 RepID=UPI0033072733